MCVSVLLPVLLTCCKGMGERVADCCNMCVGVLLCCWLFLLTVLLSVVADCCRGRGGHIADCCGMCVLLSVLLTVVADSVAECCC